MNDWRTYVSRSKLLQALWYVVQRIIGLLKYLVVCGTKNYWFVKVSKLNGELETVLNASIFKNVFTC